MKNVKFIAEKQDAKILDVQKCSNYIVKNHSNSILDIIGEIIKIETTDDGLLIHADIKDEYLNLYPSIGYNTVDDGLYILRQVSLCSERNVDESIKTVSEQIAAL
jgi:hypothetical protein